MNSAQLSLRVRSLRRVRPSRRQGCRSSRFRRGRRASARQPWRWSRVWLIGARKVDTRCARSTSQSLKHKAAEQRVQRRPHSSGRRTSWYGRIWPPVTSAGCGSAGPLTLPSFTATAPPSPSFLIFPARNSEYAMLFSRRCSSRATWVGGGVTHSVSGPMPRDGSLVQNAGSTVEGMGKALAPSIPSRIFPAPCAASPDTSCRPPRPALQACGRQRALVRGPMRGAMPRREVLIRREASCALRFLLVH